MQTQNLSLALAKYLIKDKSIKTKFFGFVRTTDAFIKYGNKLSTYMFREFVRHMYNKLDKIIAISTASKKDIVRTFNLDEKHIVVINDPIDISKIKELERERLTLEEEKILQNSIIFVGRFAKQKGIEFIPKIFDSLKKQIPDINLVLVGDGEEKNTLLDEIKKRKLKDVYIFPFSKNPFKYMSRAKVLILTSYEEGLGRVVVESFVCGTPVVAFVNEFSGHVDIIDYGKNGFLVPFGDIDQFVEKVRILLENKDLRKKFSKNAVEKAKEFELNRIISKLEQLIYS